MMNPTNMMIKTKTIKAMIEEIMVRQNRNFYSMGLPNFRLNDAAGLAETTVLLTFRDKMLKGKTEQLLNILTGKRILGKLAFIQNFVQDLAMSSLEESMVIRYKQELVTRLQVSNSTALQVSKEAMPEIMKSMVERFSKAGVCKDSLAKLVDEGLPLHPRIDSKSKPR
jgi:ABC-type siderophore export system fused ATPase/permease subunit